MKRSFIKSLQKFSRHSAVEINQMDRNISSFMARMGHIAERWLLGIMFAWFGGLKIWGEFSASSIIAKSIYFSDPRTMVPILGVWELLIGLFLIIPRAQRAAILLLMLRLPGTLFALVLNFDTCFEDSFFTPTIQGQYLIKEMTLLGAALVIGGTVRSERRFH